MVRLSFGTKRATRTEVHLTEKEAKALRDHLLGLFPIQRQPCDIGAAAMAVEAARAKGKQ